MAPAPSLGLARAPSTASPPANTPNSRPGRHGPNPTPQRGRASTAAVDDSIARPATTIAKRFMALCLLWRVFTVTRSNARHHIGLFRIGPLYRGRRLRRVCPGVKNRVRWLGHAVDVGDGSVAEP